MDAYVEGSKRNGILNVVTLGNDQGGIANLYAGVPAFRPDAQPYWLSVANVRRADEGGYRIDESSSTCSYTRMWCISAPGTDTYGPALSGRSGGRLIGDVNGEGQLLWEPGEGKPNMEYNSQGGLPMRRRTSAGASLC